jgi:hypothetical protein
MPRFALGLVAAGLILNLLLVVVILGDVVGPGRLSHGFAAAVAGLGGLFLLVGLALIEPRGAGPGRRSQTFSG